MKYAFLAAAAGIALAGTAIAQTQPQAAPTSPNPPAINSNAMHSGGGNTTAATGPVAGANSFTESQAKDRLEKRGYTSVGALHKDDQSVWRGTATKDGKSVNVAVDYQGNVFGQ